jgi:hypothetical protein
VVFFDYDAAGNRLVRASNINTNCVYLAAHAQFTDAGIVCRTPDLIWYSVGSPVELTATATGACSFDRWSGDVPAGQESTNPLALTMNGYKSITAHFITPKGDHDFDCDLDLVDFAGMQRCLGIQPVTQLCSVFDLDGDNQVELSDLPEFVSSLGVYISSPVDCNAHTTREWMNPSLDPKPDARERHALATDPVNGITWLFGGRDSANRNDTWRWNGTGWTLLDPTSKPDPRADHGMVFDTARSLIVLFGGALGTSGNPSGETWEWDGNDWTMRHAGDPSGVTAPAPRWAHAMAYDSAQNVTVLFGGRDATEKLDNTWVWHGDAGTWELMTTNGPDARQNHDMVYAESLKCVVMFGGSAVSELSDETWLWDGTSWDQTSPSTSPTLRDDHAMTYDSVRGEVLLFGGNPPAPVVYSQELHSFDGNTWELLTETGPEPRQGHALSYDPIADQLILFGGYSSTYFGDTWLYGSAVTRE